MECSTRSMFFSASGIASDSASLLCNVDAAMTTHKQSRMQSHAEGKVGSCCSGGLAYVQEDDLHDGTHQLTHRQVSLGK